MDSREIDIAVIIPALNEESEIVETIRAAENSMAVSGLSYRVVVVDNGSDDQTRELAREAGAEVMLCPECTISELRNRGVEAVDSKVVVFVDADVSLAKDWSTSAHDLIQRLIHGEKTVGGSHYLPDPSNSWPLFEWFAGLNENPSSAFIPGGHIIVSSEGFDEIGGFSSDFSTGEDVEFCSRAKESGYALTNFKNIGAIHRGDPKSITGFMRREAWHGASDFESVARVVKSKPALATIVFILLHALALCSALLANWATSLGSVGLMVLLCGATAFKLFPKSSLWRRLSNAVLAYFYYAGRTLGFYRTLIGTNS